MQDPTLSEIMHAVTQIRSELRELRRQIEGGKRDIQENGARRLPDGRMFIPGSGVLDLDPDRPRPLEAADRRNGQEQP